MIEQELEALDSRELIDLLTRVLAKRDEVSDNRRSGLRLAEFVYYPGESVIQELVGIADWSRVDEGGRDEFSAHFSVHLVQSGTCDTCSVEIVSYSKSALCPVCGAHVDCT